MDLLNNEFVIGTVVSIVVAVLAKVIPEEKVMRAVTKPVFNAGVFVSKFLILRIGKRSAERFETGFLKTLISIVCKIPLIFLDGMLADNEKRKK